MTLKTDIGNNSFDSCMMNASGVWCSTVDELEALVNSKAATFVTKTATLAPREGNSLPRVHHFGSSSINSSGLPNEGVDYYLAALANFEVTHPDRAFFLSVTELAEDQIDAIMQRVHQSDYHGLVELNLSCPNVIGKPQVGYDFETTARILDRTFSYFDQPLGVKLPPYFDLSHFDQMAEILNRYPLTYVNSINSIGNGLVIAQDAVTIAPKQGYGGLGGAIIKQTALANVRAFYTRLRSDIAIIGTGGVTCGRDVFEHLLCGASMVQIATALLQEGPSIFARLEDELKAIMEEYGYTSIDDFKGKLKDNI